MAIESSVVLSGLAPAAFWQRFEELTTIARPSRDEEPAIADVERWADSRGFERRSDAARNMVISVPANGTQIAWISTALIGIGIVAVFGL